MEDIRWKQRFDNYCKSLNLLQCACQEYADTNIDIIKEGIIHRFITTFELAWKILDDYLKYQGETMLYGAKSVIRLAFNRGLIHSGELWLRMLESRHNSIFNYEESYLTTEFDNILANYLPLLLALEVRLRNVE